MLNNVDDNQEALNAFTRKIKDEDNNQLPCQITEVNADGTVDCLVIRNDQEEDVVFPNIPIRHFETTRAYVFLGVGKGDKGVIRFFDRSVEDYKLSGSTTYNNDDRQHSLSDGLFDYGFYPLNDAYAFPKDKNIAIGNKNGSFLLTIGNDGQLICTASSYEFNGPTKFNNDVEFASKLHAIGEISSDTDVKALDKSLKLHAHTSATPGNPTSPPN